MAGQKHKVMFGIAICNVTTRSCQLATRCTFNLPGNLALHIQISLKTHLQWKRKILSQQITINSQNLNGLNIKRMVCCAEPCLAVEEKLGYTVYVVGNRNRMNSSSVYCGTYNTYLECLQRFLVKHTIKAMKLHVAFTYVSAPALFLVWPPSMSQTGNLALSQLQMQPEATGPKEEEEKKT